MGVNWDTQPLGELPDSVLARQLGVSRQRVHQARTKRGIPRFERPSEKVDWDSVPLGDETDAELAEKLGVSAWTVGRAREARKIPPAVRSAPELTKEALTQLYVVDQLSTSAISEVFGCCSGTVYARLVRWGIPTRSKSEAMRTEPTRHRCRAAARQRHRRKKERRGAPLQEDDR